MKRRILYTLILTVSIVAVVALDSGIYFARLDLTENRIYTLSPATWGLFRSIRQELDITYYVSDKLRAISPVPQQIEDVLGEYRASSGGKIRVRFVDPQRAGVAQQVQNTGILPQQMSIVEQSQRTTAQVFSGIDVQYLNRHEAIPFVVSVDTLEYALDVAISKLVGAAGWNAAILIGDSARSIPNDYSLTAQALGRYYAITPVDPGQAIPSGTRVLIVFGGRNLSNADLRPVDRFVMQGGSVLFCVPGVSIDTAGNLAATPQGDLPVIGMIADYGVKIAPSLVLDTSVKDFRTLVQSGGQYLWQDLGPYPHWVAIQPDDVSKLSAVTRHFTGLDLLWPSPLVGLGVAGIEYEPILRSSRHAWIMQAPFDTNPNRAGSYDTSGNQRPAQYTLGYELVGRFRSHYGSHAESGVPARMIVIGDDDFATNLLQYSDSAYNLDFLENAVDWLAGNDSFLSIKAKGQWDPRLDRISDPLAKAATFRFAEIVNIFVLPLTVLLFGVRRYLVRRRMQRTHEVHS